MLIELRNQSKVETDVSSSAFKVYRLRMSCPKSHLIDLISLFISRLWDNFKFNQKPYCFTSNMASASIWILLSFGIFIRIRYILDNRKTDWIEMIRLPLKCPLQCVQLWISWSRVPKSFWQNYIILTKFLNNYDILKF